MHQSLSYLAAACFCLGYYHFSESGMAPNKKYGDAASGATRKAASGAAACSEAASGTQPAAKAAQAARPAWRPKKRPSQPAAVPKKAPKAARGAGRAVQPKRRPSQPAAVPKKYVQRYQRKTIRVQGLFRQRHWISPEHADAVSREIEELKQRKAFKGLEFFCPQRRQIVDEYKRHVT